jgi:hypothetical protein
MIDCAKAQFVQDPLVQGKEVVVLMEITMSNLLSSGALDAQDFLSRVDLLAEIGFTVLISIYSEYYRLTSYFRRYTKEMIGVALGINNLMEVFNERYYENLEGDILESFGRLFRHEVKLYVYPMREEAYARYIVESNGNGTSIQSSATNVLISAKNVRIVDRLSNLYAHLLENHYIYGRRWSPSPSRTPSSARDFSAMPTDPASPCEPAVLTSHTRHNPSSEYQASADQITA